MLLIVSGNWQVTTVACSSSNGGELTPSHAPFEHHATTLRLHLYDTLENGELGDISTPILYNSSQSMTQHVGDYSLAPEVTTTQI